jgi:FAD/FMN-containing dehydrogenase
LRFFFLSSAKLSYFGCANKIHDSGSYGLAIDNLVKVTIVTADGSIRTASSTENVDLFWAIRGGGCNFGVVTEFVYKLHPQRKTVYAGRIVFAPSALEKLIAATENWWVKGPNEKEGMVQLLTRGPDRKVRL